MYGVRQYVYRLHPILILEPSEGLESSRFSLQGSCSTSELRRRILEAPLPSDWQINDFAPSSQSNCFK